jgi:hypothetical protein
MNQISIQQLDSHPGGRWILGFAGGVLGLVAVLVIGCSSFQAPGGTREDMTYLTPVSTQTLEHFRFDSPIKNKMEAVIAARVTLSGTRLRANANPQIVSVEELALAEARRRVARPGVSVNEDRPADTPVWLIVFEGEWQVFPPDPSHTITPPPPSHGCVYVLLDANDPGRGEVGAIECAP